MDFITVSDGDMYQWREGHVKFSLTDENVHIKLNETMEQGDRLEKSTNPYFAIS